MIEHPTVYKRTSTGAIQKWWIDQEGNQYRTNSGQLEGVVTTSRWTVCEGKNLGRANATSPEEQATAEVAAEYRKKLAQGKYAESLDLIDQETYFSPMLAYSYDDNPVSDKELEEGNVFSQPKLDGVRCIINQKGLWTRKGKPIIAAPHILDAVRVVFEQKPFLVLDGELYNHEYHDRLNYLSGLVRKTKLTDDELSETQLLQFHCYDCIGSDPEELEDTDYDRWDFPHNAHFFDRYHRLWHHPIIASIWAQSDGHECLQLVETRQPMNRAELEAQAQEDLERGYEGTIVRRNDSEYENKRTKKLLKWKNFQDREFPIIDIIEGQGNRSGMAGNVVYRTDDGKPFGSGIAGGEEFYKQLWQNREKYIGRGVGTVRFFKYTEYGIPYLPVTKAVFPGERDL
jgi:DNA ligase 1